MQLICSAWALHRARANVGEVMLSLGAQLMLYANARTQTPPRQLVLNGLALQVSTGTSRDAPQTVLDAFAAMCKQRAGQLRATLAAPLARGGAIDSDMGLLDGVLRVGNETRGALACLDVGTRELSLEEWVERAKRVAETGDFAQLGALRYVSVQGSEHGSFFVATWSEGSLALAHAFPARGDVPGRDLELVPRPGGARRILSAWESGRTEATNVYLAQRQTPAQLEAFYRRELRRRNFSLLDAGTPRSTTIGGLIAEQAGRLVAFSFSKTPAGEGVVTISSL
jgi:hypothetical protein